MSPYARTVKTGSGALAVQIVLVGAGARLTTGLTALAVSRWIKDRTAGSGRPEHHHRCRTSDRRAPQALETVTPQLTCALTWPNSRPVQVPAAPEPYSTP